MPTRWSHAPCDWECWICQEWISEGEQIALIATPEHELLLICAPCGEARNPEDDDLDWSE